MKIQVLITCLFLPSLGFSENEANSASFYQRKSPFQLVYDTQRPRGIFLPQIVSLFLPGFDQYWEKQYAWGAAYTATALAGYIYAGNRAAALGSDTIKKENKNAYSSKNNTYREYNLGSQLTIVSGGLSTYHSFRTAVRSREQTDDFYFLREEESIGDLFLSPLRFDYLLRPTTLLPLAIAGVIAYVNNIPWSLAQNNRRSAPLKSSDYFFSVAPSYGAGVSEEALFRGWLLPSLRYQFDHELLANLTQAGVFGLAHLSTVQFPLVQGLLGFYLGSVTIKNRWTLSESIFIHAWWDIISFLGSYSTRDRNNPNTLYRPSIVIPLEIHF